MKNNKDILKNIEEKTTPDNFTSKIMEDIFALENETILSTQLKESSLIETSTSFTENLLLEIEKEKKLFKPIEIFSQKQFAAIAIIMISLMAFAIDSNTKIVNPSFKNIIPKLPNFNFEFPQISPIFITILFSISILLCLEYYLKSYKKV